MTILAIDVRMYRSSGIGTYLQNLIPLLLNLSPGVQFYLLGRSSDLRGAPWLQPEKVRLVECSSRIYSVAEQVELPVKIPRSAGLFWSPHYIVPLFYYGTILATVHDVFHLAMPKLTGGLHKRLYARVMFSALRRKARAIICVSQFTQNEFLKHVGQGNLQSTVIYNGIDQSWFQIEKAQPPHARPYILYVGNVKPHKNLPRLIQAFAEIKDQIPHDLIIVGQTEGFITADPRALQEARSLGARVKFTGALNHESPLLRQYYAHASLFASPSLYESFCLPAMEAMASGCPVLVSNLAAFPEIYRDAAGYCNPYDVGDIARNLLSLLQNESLRSNLREKGLKRAREFSWETAATATWGLMEKLMRA